MQTAVTGNEVAILYIEKFREYALQVRAEGSNKLRIHFCPWCGQKFSETLRYRWLDELERLGIDPSTDAIPEKFTDERWHSELKL